MFLVSITNLTHFTQSTKTSYKNKRQNFVQKL